MISKELCWMVLPITGLLSQLGGTFWKAYRRYFIPIIAVATGWYFTGNFYYGWIFMAIHLWGAFCLPITLKGDSIPEHLINQLWLPIWGLLVCSSALWLNTSYWLVAVVCGLLLAILVMLSNVPATAKYFQWKWIECMQGMLAVFPLCIVITLQP